MGSKLLILVNKFEQMSVYCMIHLNGESVLHPYSSLFEGNVRLLLSSNMNCVPWQSYPISYSHPGKSTFQESRCV